MIRPLATGWTCLCLTLSAGCSSTVEVLPDPAPPRPPSTLLRPCPHPELDTTTNRGLVRGLLDYRAALDGCSADKAAISRFFDSLPP